MTVARPFHSARILGAPDVPVSVREDAGRMVLDSARAPHVDGALTLSVPNVGMLEDLDPRDARRLVLDVYPQSHLDPVYTAWVEQRRNYMLDPRFTVPANWVATAGTYTVTAGVMDVTFTAAATSNAITPNTTAWWTSWAAGQPISAGYMVENIGAVSVSMRIAVWNNAAYTYGPTVVIPPGAQAVVSASLVVPAGSAYAQPRLHFAPGSPSGTRRLLISQPIAEKTAALGTYFYGASDPAGELSRTRWIGTVNDSASVQESRALTGYVQVPDGSPRTFDLGIRETTPARDAGTVQVQLASDEALLDDFSQLFDDKGARAHETSLRGVVDYVLDKIGAELEPGGEDADVTAYWAITNLITNPRLANDAAGWQTGSGGSAGGRVVMSAPLPPVGNTAYRWTAAAGDSNAVPLTTRYRVTAGKWYVFTAYLCSGTARQARCSIQWWSSGGSVPSATSHGALINSDVTAFRRMVIIAQCPPGADEAVPYINTIGNAAGNLHYGSMGMFYEGDELVPYFDGATAATAFYLYAFQAAAHGSTSTRTPVIDRPPAALTMRAGISGLAFLAPLVQAAGFRLVCNEHRQWTLRSALYREPGTQAFRETVNVITANEQLSRASDEWFDGAVFAYTWSDDNGIEQTRIDAYALPGATKVIRREIRAPYPGPGRAQYAVRRAQGRGRVVSAMKQADWTEAAEQEFSALLDGTPIQTGIANRVEFDIGQNTVTTTSRTTEIPAGAIDLLTGTINALTGTINTL